MQGIASCADPVPRAIPASRECRCSSRSRCHDSSCPRRATSTRSSQATARRTRRRNGGSASSAGFRLARHLRRPRSVPRRRSRRIGRYRDRGGKARCRLDGLRSLDRGCSPRTSDLAGAQGVGPRASFVVCAAESLPFRDASFGCASAVAVLEHLDDDAAAGGSRGWYVPADSSGSPCRSPTGTSCLHSGPCTSATNRRLGHKRHYHEAAVVRVLERAGFRHVETTYSGHAVKVLQLVLDRLLPLSNARRDRLWWSLERLDVRGVRRAYDALQLNAVFRRAEEPAPP